MIHPQLLVAPVNSVSYSTHMCTSCDSGTPLYTGIHDLWKVKMKLESVVDWLNLGLALGLLYPTLETIEKEQRGEVKQCKTKMLASWLRQQDVPSWAMLRRALEEIGERQLANDLCGSSHDGELELQVYWTGTVSVISHTGLGY